MDIISSLSRLSQAGNTEGLFASTPTEMLSITGFHSLHQVECWFKDYCQKPQAPLGRQYSDTACQTVDRVNAYIACHYAESSLRVNTLCARLYLSATCFFSF